MSKNGSLTKSNLNIPASIREMIEHPPLLESEDPRDYQKLFRAIAEDVKPDGVIEWLWVYDIVYHTWEIRRLRKCRALAPSVTVEAKSVIIFQVSIDILQCIDSLLASAERRRDNILREVEIRREVLSRRLKKVSSQLIEAKSQTAVT